VLGGAPPAEDWSDVPTLRESIASLVRAHEALRGIYDGANRTRLYEHLRKTLDEDELIDVLVETVAMDIVLHRGWDSASSKLSPEGKASLGVRLREMSGA